MKTTTKSQACCWHDTYLEGKVNNFAFLNPFTWLQRIPAHPASQSCQMVDNMQLQLCLERPFSNVGGCPVQLDRPRAWLKDGSTATAILTSWIMSGAICLDGLSKMSFIFWKSGGKPMLWGEVALLAATMKKSQWKLSHPGMFGRLGMRWGCLRLPRITVQWP